MSLTITGLTLTSGQVSIGSGVPSIIANTTSFIINNPTPASNETFGISVDVDGNTAIIGSHADPSGSGEAYIYNVTTGSLLRTIVNPFVASLDWFGHSVGISGNKAIIGAYGDDVGASSSGSAYIYDVTTGVRLHTLVNPQPTASDRFGESVAISGDYAIVGSRLDDPSGVDAAGSVYIFSTNTGALLHTIPNPSPSVNGEFGLYLDMNDTYSLVSAVWENEVYMFDNATGTLLHTFTNPGNGSSFGWSVNISNSYVVISARGNTNNPVYVYNTNTKALLHTFTAPAETVNTMFGFATALSGDKLIVTAATSLSQTGNGYVYTYDLSSGYMINSYTNPELPVSGTDNFAQAVATNGTQTLVGVPLYNTNNHGRVYVIV